MTMNKEKYEELMLRFAKELHDVGVTDEMKKTIESQYDRQPNVISCSSKEDTDRFVYIHEGFRIEAVRKVELVIKKC